MAQVLNFPQMLRLVLICDLGMVVVFYGSPSRKRPGPAPNDRTLPADAAGRTEKPPPPDPLPATEDWLRNAGIRYQGL